MIVFTMGLISLENIKSRACHHHCLITVLISHTVISFNSRQFNHECSLKRDTYFPINKIFYSLMNSTLYFFLYNTENTKYVVFICINFFLQFLFKSTEYGKHIRNFFTKKNKYLQSYLSLIF